MSDELRARRLRKHWETCVSCAEAVYGGRVAPTEEYAGRVARQLFGTGCHESADFVYVRQMSFDFRSTRGAFGYWQLEAVAVVECVRRLERSRALGQRCADWLFIREGAPSRWYANHVEGLYEKPERWDVCDLLLLTALWPELGCLFARLTYMRDAEPVPEGVEAMAAYWGRVYNTRNEAEKNSQWAESYRAGCSVAGIRA